VPRAFCPRPKVREFEARDVVMASELLSGAAKKDAATRLATHAMHLSSVAPPRRKGFAREAPRSALEHLAEHAMALAAEPLIDKVPRRG
jgi:hypothetical protein